MYCGVSEPWIMREVVSPSDWSNISSKFTWSFEVQKAPGLGTASVRTSLGYTAKYLNSGYIPVGVTVDE